MYNLYVRQIDYRRPFRYSMIFTPSRSLTMSRTPQNSRFLTSESEQGRSLVVVYTSRRENIRIISARQAEAHERSQYEAKR